LVAEVLPFKGLTMINDFIKMVHTRLNPQAHVSGILITRWEASNLSRGIENNLRQALGDTVFCTKIRKNVRLAEAPLENANIVDYDPRSNGAKDYLSFAEEFLERMCLEGKEAGI
jgi:chromosome partitioning protein